MKLMSGARPEDSPQRAGVRSGKLATERKTKPFEKKTKVLGIVQNNKLAKLLVANHDSLLVLTEHKEPPPPYRGSEAPSILSNPRLFRAVDTKGSLEMRNIVRAQLGTAIYGFRINTAFTMGSSGGGVVNSAAFSSGIASVTEFSSFSAIFDEFYIGAVNYHWMPASRYLGPIGFVATTYTTASNVPLGVADLQHSQAAYSTIVAMTNNFRYMHTTTGDPFTYLWKNTEPMTSTVVDVTGQTVPFQGWGPCSNVAYCTGGVQFLSNTTPTLPSSQILGTFHVTYQVYFRIRQ